MCSELASDIWPTGVGMELALCGNGKNENTSSLNEDLTMECSNVESHVVVIAGRHHMSTLYDLSRMKHSRILHTVAAVWHTSPSYHSQHPTK